MDQQNNAKPESEAWKDIPTPAWGLQPRDTRNLSLSTRTSPESAPTSLFLQRRLTPQNNLSEDSEDSEENSRVKGQEPYNILSTPARSPRSSNFQVSDSDSDVPRRHRMKKTKLRVESSTEDERRQSKKRIFKRRSRQLSESD